MQTYKIIQLLKSNNRNHQNMALSNIDQQMKSSVLSKIQIPVFVDSEDIWQAGLIVLWKYISVHRKDFDSSKLQSIERFLCTVCKRIVLKTIKRDKKYLFGEDNYLSSIIDDQTPEKLLQETEMQQQVKTVFACYINNTAQEVIINRYYEGMSYEDMEQKMNTSANTLKTTKYRAVKKLRKESENNPALKRHINFLLQQVA